MHKTELRQHLRHQRKHYSPTLQQQAALQITRHVAQLPQFNTSQTLAGYIAYQGEVDVAAIFKLGWQQHKKCYLPVIHTESAPALRFVNYQLGDTLHPNRYHVLEPEYRVEKTISPTHLDLVLVPLLGFDQFGNRLGSGQGYYDRSFAFLSQMSRPAKPFLLGVAYSWQQVNEISCDEWDVKLDGVVTEKEVFLFN